MFSRQPVSAISVGDDVSSYFSSATVTGGIDYDPGGAEFSVSLSIKSNDLFKTSYTTLNNGGTANYSENGVDASWHWQWRCGDHNGGMPVLEKAKSVSAKVVEVEDSSLTIEVTLTMTSQMYPNAGKSYPQPIVGQIKVERKTYKTSVSAKIDHSPLYSGETFDSTLVVNVGDHDNINTHNGSSTPSDTEVQRIIFTVNSGVTLENTKVKGSTSTAKSPCDYYRSEFGSRNISCSDLKGEKSSESDTYTYNENASGSITGSLQQGTNTFSVKNIPVPDGDDNIGKKICIAIGVKPASDNDGNWNISSASCRTIAKKPSAIVKDGSLYSESTISTSLSTKSTGTYGSWVEYLVVSNDTVKNLASGAALINSSISGCSLYPLTISNSECTVDNPKAGEAGVVLSDSFTNRLEGLFSSPTVMTSGASYEQNISGETEVGEWITEPDYCVLGEDGNWETTSSAAGSSTYGVNYGCLNTGVRYGKITGSGTAVLFSSTNNSTVNSAVQDSSNRSSGNTRSDRHRSWLEQLIHSIISWLFGGGGRKHHSRENSQTENQAANTVIEQTNNINLSTVLYSKTDIEIAGNYEDTATYANASEVPQLIIISEGDITIDENVTRVDAWLISLNGTISTCDVSANELSSDRCNQSLAINGAVYAKNLKLYRTASQASVSPAETFTLSPTSYLWTATQSTYKTNSIFESSTRELAPRF